MAKKVTIKNFETVLDNMKELFKNSEKGDKQVMVNDLNEMLDMQRDNDFFGTEGQSDPRGDNRN
jgi:flagellar motor component MotA